ncbi:MAG TPA: GTP 3',8-cyclase MoaA, partial [Polyangiaceae bacterium]|nr:GTP 3',8-cyclase MoaA [Polyangiaceae bacterium]
GRPFRDLRLSITDRCNFRCRYCMPREHFDKEFRFMPRAELLSFEEITRVVGVLAPLGLEKIRITGGEPLLRGNLPELVRMLRGNFAGDMAMTTNASRLKELARPLTDAGLSRVTVSMDALDEPTFRQMTDSEYTAADVLAGIEAAAAGGLTPLKLNCVVKRGSNEHAILDLARHFRGTDHVVRFIEFMDVGMTNGWRLEHVVSGREIVELIAAEFKIEPVDPDYRGEVAARYRYCDGQGEFGVITSVTQPFCGDCTRLRLSAEGKLYTCLYAHIGLDLRALLRGGASDAQLQSAIRDQWEARTDRYSEERSQRTRSLPRVEMSYIGG